MKLGLQQKVKKLKKMAEFKLVNNVVILDLIEDKYYFNKKEIDIRKVRAKVIVLNDIPRSSVKKKGSDKNCE